MRRIITGANPSCQQKRSFRAPQPLTYLRVSSIDDQDTECALLARWTATGTGDAGEWHCLQAVTELATVTAS